MGLGYVCGLGQERIHLVPVCNPTTGWRRKYFPHFTQKRSGIGCHLLPAGIQYGAFEKRRHRATGHAFRISRARLSWRATCVRP